MTRFNFDYAVIGHPVSHSRSPGIHAAFAQQFNISLNYGRIDAAPDEFELVVEQFFAQGGKGLNVTVPFKERAFNLARSHLSWRAQEAGAVNTLWLDKDAHVHGCNTDGVGLVRDLKRLGMLKPGMRVLLLGAGGAARGAMGPLLAEGCAALMVANRTASKAIALVRERIERDPASQGTLAACSMNDQVLSECWDLIINATSSSLAGSAIELPTGSLGPQTFVYDMMYGPTKTPFLASLASVSDEHMADGLGMLVCQAAESFRIWHGVEPEVATVIDDVRRQLCA